MADTLGRARLARAAQALNAGRRSGLPALLLMTDDDRLPDPLSAASALPRGSTIIVRAQKEGDRARLLAALRPIARARDLLLLVANDPILAAGNGVAGLHLAEANIRTGARWRTKHGRSIVTAAGHSLRACAMAARCGADAVLLSPVLPTESHAGAAALGAAKARFIARLAPLPVYALGGMAAQRAGLLKGSRFVGLAAITALAA